MRPHLILLISMAFALSCKKKADDPQPTPEDELIYQTTFDDATWSTYSTGKSTAVYSGNQFGLTIHTPQWYSYQVSPAAQLNDQYSVQTDLIVSIDDPGKLGYAGFVYNYIDDNNHSVLNVGTNGTFYVFKRQAGIVKTLFYATVSTDLIKGSGAKNTLVLKQRNNSLEFIFNGYSQGLLPFSKETQPVKVGVAACTVGDHFYTPVSALFDNFVVKKIY